MLLVLAIVLNSLVVLAQKSVSQDPIYGFDPLLYNGLTYSYFPTPGTGGSQYLFKEFDEYGTITIRGIVYQEVNINYDVFNQQLVMKFTNSSGAKSLIAISAAWLEEFDLNGVHFEAIAKADTVKAIFQVLGNGQNKILISFGKELLLDSFKSNRNHYFSEARKNMFVLSGEKITGFIGNRGFIKCFDPTKQDEIKKYIRKNNIQAKNASDLQLGELINYCNTLN